MDKTFYEDRINRYHLNDKLTHYTSKENPLESMTHESKAHEAAAMILHYTGTHHYRHKVAKIDKKHSPAAPTTTTKQPTSLFASMKGMLMGQTKDTKKKQYEVKRSRVSTQKDDEDDETVLGRPSSKDIAEEDDDTINLMKQIKFEGRGVARELLHTDLHSIGDEVDPARMRFQDSNKHHVHHTPHASHKHPNKAIKVQHIAPISVAVSPANTPFATPSTSPRPGALTHTKSVSKIQFRHHHSYFRVPANKVVPI